MEEKPKVYRYLPEIRKDIFESLRDYCSNYDFTWLIQYLIENFDPDELYGEDYMVEWAERNGYYKKD